MMFLKILFTGIMMFACNFLFCLILDTSAHHGVADSLFVTLIISEVIGLIPATIAHKKGRNFILWWVYGYLLFIIALIHSLLMDKSEEALAERGELKKCPYCAEYINRDAKVCRYCGRNLVATDHGALEDENNGPYTKKKDD